MRNHPKISVCVPVYNAERYLASFLDSVMQQTFEEYEIILADDHSTDNSMQILREYEAAFPKKIFVYHMDGHGGPGKGRNFTFQKSQGDYIYWCDADDLIHPKAFEMLYREASQYNADIVCGNAITVKEKYGEIIGLSPYSKNATIAVSNETAIHSAEEFWRMIIKRNLIEKVGEMPENILLDDIRYLPVLNSYAGTIRFLDFPVYYWFNRGFSLSSTLTKELCVESINAANYALQHCNPKYAKSVQFFAATRARMNTNKRWPFYDIFVNEVRKYSTWFYDNEQIKENGQMLDHLRQINSLADIHFPNIIYVDGFHSAPTAKRLKELQEKVFHDGCQIVVLSEKTCDISENEYIKRAYDKNELDFVSRYFALKKIYENGGVFLHNNIRILNYFSYLKYQNAFFALIDKTTYSEWIFGAPAGSEAIAAILKTYSDSWDKKGEYMPLSERISIILTAKYGIPLDGKARLLGKVVSVFSPEFSVADTRFGDVTKKCAFEHDFSAYAGNDDYVTIPRSSLYVLMTPPLGAAPPKTAREKALERELADLKAGNTYKFMMKIRAIGDGPFGPFLKKIFHVLLKIRKKFKRK